MSPEVAGQVSNGSNKGSDSPEQRGDGAGGTDGSTGEVTEESGPAAPQSSLRFRAREAAVAPHWEVAGVPSAMGTTRGVGAATDGGPAGTEKSVWTAEDPEPPVAS